jgi:GTP-binding protein EngB required for normal cell division
MRDGTSMATGPAGGGPVSGMVTGGEMTSGARAGNDLVMGARPGFRTGAAFVARETGGISGITDTSGSGLPGVTPGAAGHADEPQGRASRTVAALSTRLSALARLVQIGAARSGPDGVSPELLDDTRALLGRAGERLRLSSAHTVVALAGGTGSGKSSLFNRLAGADFSSVGVTRPVTKDVHACVWGVSGSGSLLEWLGVPSRFRYARASALDSGERAMTGLVLLDMPDHDSVMMHASRQVDHLVELADLLIWVLDPQKYADAAVHRRFLVPLAGHSEVTAVVLNQADVLSPAQLEDCVNDLRRLLDSENLHDVQIIVTSATTGTGIDVLRGLLADAVIARQAAASRLSADVDGIAARFIPYAGDDFAALAPGATEAGAGEAAASLPGARPGSTVPGSTVPGSAMPGGAGPGSAMPGSAMPGSVTPGGFTPGGFTSGGALPRGAVPGGGLSGGGLSGGAMSGAAVPTGGALPSGIPSPLTGLTGAENGGAAAVNAAAGIALVARASSAAAILAASPARLAAAFARAAGVTAIGDALQSARELRAVDFVGWPVAWFVQRIVRRDPVRKIRLGKLWAELRGVTAGPSGAQQSEIDNALTELADEISPQLPKPWSNTIRAAIRSRAEAIPGVLGERIGVALPPENKIARWWRVVGVWQGLLLGCVIVGIIWAIAIAVLGGLVDSKSVPHLFSNLGLLPLIAVLIVALLVLGWLTSSACVNSVRTAAIREKEEVAKDMRDQEMVVRPAEQELAELDWFRAELRIALGQNS